MTNRHTFVTIGFLTLMVPALPAQGIVVPPPLPLYAASGGGFFYAHGGRHSTLAVAVGTYGSYGGYVAPYGYNGIAPVGVVVVPPLFLSSAAVAPPPPRPRRVLRLDDIGDLDPTLRGGDADERERAAALARADRPAPPPKKPEVVPAPAPPPPAPLPPPHVPGPARPWADPQRESRRLLELGRAAFQNREYGLAAERFRDAIQHTPDEAFPYLILGQALIAAGQFTDALAAIHTGMRLRPDWPGVQFAPRELYGPNADDLADHFARLRIALAHMPDDAGLLFLLAHQLWFDGRKDEARPLFQRARIRAADPAPIDRFLAVRPVF